MINKAIKFITLKVMFLLTDKNKSNEKICTILKSLFYNLIT